MRALTFLFFSIFLASPAFSGDFFLKAGEAVQCGNQIIQCTDSSATAAKAPTVICTYTRTSKPIYSPGYKTYSHRGQGRTVEAAMKNALLACYCNKTFDDDSCYLKQCIDASGNELQVTSQVRNLVESEELRCR